MEVGIIMRSSMHSLGHYIVGLLMCVSLIGGTSQRCAAVETPISGEINRHESIAQIIPCDSTVRMRAPTQFRVGDEVLMIQMKGARIVVANDSTFGTITDMNGAGAVEFLTIGAITNEWITFTSTWVHPYDADGALQLVSVPHYSEAVTSGMLTTKPFNGTVGGVVVLRVDGALRLLKDIDVSGKGFHGGATSFPRDVCVPKMWAGTFFFGEGAEKGDGIATVAGNQILTCRGPFATGGGGGNGGNAGGAGGSNGGSGGHGGDANNFCPNFLDQGGYPGQAVDSLLLKQRLFLGGGGGGGHQNNAQGTGGAAGGGIVIIKAGSIIADGGVIYARGLTVTDTAAWKNSAAQQPGDGAGGGGAGGSILLDVKTVTGNLFVNVRGGNGGMVGARYQPNGPGGGGGGGAVILTNAIPSLNSTLDGGVPGYHTSVETADSVRNSPWGATAGQSGVVINGFTWKIPSHITLSASGGGDICLGDSVTLAASPGFMLYRWTNGRTERTIRVGDPGVYSVTATDSSGCSQTVGGLVVTSDPTRLDVPSFVDFGSVDYKRRYRRVLTLQSKDDDTIIVTGVTNAVGFSVVDPSVFPATVAPYGRLDIEIEFFADEPREYLESIAVSVSKPCAFQQNVELRAKVNPIRIRFFMPDTVARMGMANMSIPIYSALRPDTVNLPDTRMRIRLSMNSKVFAPERVTRGTIVGDVVDLIRDLRTVTIEIDSLEIPALTSVITRIIGTVLLSGSDRTVLDLIDIEWLRVNQTPILTIDDGSLTVDPVCFSQGRLIRVMGTSRLILGPNPAGDNVTLSTMIRAAGDYTFSIVDIQGRELLTHVEHITDSTTSRQFSLVIPTAAWEQGAYVATLRAPLSVETVPFVVHH
ncbi:MAG: hypothetical protein NTX15_07915 [Candidatus Kapabacteria bacterium]|nr:hypothetical protein [Candidatus Kapabacteria bacterium]